MGVVRGGPRAWSERVRCRRVGMGLYGVGEILESVQSIPGQSRGSLDSSWSVKRCGGGNNTRVLELLRGRLTAVWEIRGSSLESSGTAPRAEPHDAATVPRHFSGDVGHL
jgi:hypothetical protein